MNILFLSLINIQDINVSGIYTDLLSEFYDNGHNIYIVSPSERRYKKSTNLKKGDRVHYLNVWTLNYQKTNFFEKGLSTLLIENQYKFGIKKYFPKVKFDLILYPTPPITFASVVRYIKKRDNAFSYLLLKDIFPQNAVDLNIMSENSLIHRFFRRKEKLLYEISDAIGCMSPANVRYILEHNKELDPQKVSVCPNSIRIKNKKPLSIEKRNNIRHRYNIPVDKQVYIYGGNLGKPQNISFIIDCLRKEQNDLRNYFVIVGSGTEYNRLYNYIVSENPKNFVLFPYMDSADFGQLVESCDAGLIFLDHRFTIPNYPSRLLSYMSAGLPILAATDKNTDIGSFLEETGIGVWCESSDTQSFHEALLRLHEMKIPRERVMQTLKDNFDVFKSYKTIISKINEADCK